MRTPPAVDRCRFCGCSEFDACAVGLDVHDTWIGCRWTDRTRTVCSVCAPAAKAETIALRVVVRADAALRAPGVRHAAEFVAAFHRGFVVGWFSVSTRSPYGRNPYKVGAWSLLVDAWDVGQRSGAEASRSYQRVCGPLTNAPRRAVLRVPRGTSPTVQ